MTSPPDSHNNRLILPASNYFAGTGKGPENRISVDEGNPKGEWSRPVADPSTSITRRPQAVANPRTGRPGTQTAPGRPPPPQTTNPEPRVPATEVARRAGQGVALLLKIYAHSIDGRLEPITCHHLRICPLAGFS